MKAANPIPEGYTGAIPYLAVQDAAAALHFYARAFGATETLRMAGPDGRIGHAEFTIGRARLMIADEHPELEFVSPKTLGGSPVLLHLYVEDVDAFAARAAAAGARITRPVEDQFYGDRAGQLEDPFGHRWWIGTRKEDLTFDEIRERAAALYPGS